jgi:hypothetical protein
MGCGQGKPTQRKGTSNPTQEKRQRELDVIRFPSLNKISDSDKSSISSFIDVQRDNSSTFDIFKRKSTKKPEKGKQDLVNLQYEQTRLYQQMEAENAHCCLGISRRQVDECCDMLTPYLDWSQHSSSSSVTRSLMNIDYTLIESSSVGTTDLLRRVAIMEAAKKAEKLRKELLAKEVEQFIDVNSFEARPNMSSLLKNSRINEA